MNDEQLLTLYWYGDGLSDSERRDLANRLEREPDLAARFAAVKEDLGALDLPAAPLATAAMVARWRLALDQEINASATRSTNRWRRFMPAGLSAAAAVVLALGVFIGMQLEDRDDSLDTVHATVSPEETDDPAQLVTGSEAVPDTLERSLALHLQNTKVQLAGLASDNIDDRTRLVAQIIYQNRLFAVAARANGAEELARLLRAFEPVLLATLAEDASTNDLAVRRDQLDFELGVTLTKITGRASNTITAL
ncbi:MAG: hypothetical protein HKN70_09345 [Gammaproteobacteria bacterium]|nr:hypothetical protein [Gammaproteobacteria bacterium]